ncbi:hypothetical protein EIP86_005035 [Pleurotus ostreatoroseus]|nr:hypothetical protein EIP86_005035 [Pleurotus ostreatoroseus]
MGLLALGTPLAWDDAKQYADHVREHGITQFLHIWDRLKDRCGDELLWGDEIEYMVVAFDNDDRDARLSLRQSEILAKLQTIVDDIADCGCDQCVFCVSPISLTPSVLILPRRKSVPTYHPEYGRFMLESTPGSPYTGSLTDLLCVESNMRYRLRSITLTATPSRQLARKYLKPNELPFTLTSFPRLGVPGVFTEPYYDPANAVSSHSLFLPEEITNPHARFPSVFLSSCHSNTPRPFIDPTIPWQRNIYAEDPEAKNGAALIDHVYMDAMGFGMGCSCLQLTFQACNVGEARRLYDALVPIAPLMLALTAASPLWRGYIADVDSRWDVVSASVDDRTEEERGLKPLKENRFRIPKSRYASVSLYISDVWMNRPEYNDIDAPYDAAIFDRLRKHDAPGLDEPLSRHIAHLFIRDPLVIFSESIDQDDETSNDHFENIQSTNWQTIRFKPPPANSPIGWRVEFRPMEVQPTDFANAAFAVFIVLLSRAILHFGLNFYLPISKVDENMARAQKRDAVRTQKFFFRKDVFPAGVPSPLSSPASSPHSSGSASPVDADGTNGLPRAKRRKLQNCFAEPPKPDAGLKFGRVEDEYDEFTLDELFNGKGEHFIGLLGLVYAYLDTLDVERDELTRIHEYLNLVKSRADLSLGTPASWIRNFVRTHPAYKHDSVVSKEINYDLFVAVDEM